MKALTIISVILTILAIGIGINQISHHNIQSQAVSPPEQYQYLRVDVGAPHYYALPPGYPQEYYTYPQFYFYYEPNLSFYRPGISVFLGCGWWYTPGCGLINIGFFGPGRPFSCWEHDGHTTIVRSSVNISSVHTTINVNKAHEAPHEVPHGPPAHHPSPPPHHK